MTPWVTRLIIANVALFLVSAMVPAVYMMLALVPAAVIIRPWTLVTYMFLHAGIMHLLFNMIGLFFFGPRLEARLGARDFLLLYLLSGLGGALLSFLFAPHASVVGASGAVLGVLAGYARFWPDDQIYIWGVLPVSARAMVIGLAALSVLSGFTGMGGGIAHFAHLGGLAVGWGFILWTERRRKAAWGPKKRSPLADAGASARARRKRWESIRLEGMHEVNRQEAERVLAKLREHGPGGLTEREREFLDRFAPRE